MDCGMSIIADGEDSLGIKLVNLGYDLWMNNSRGTRYSKMHIHSEHKLFKNSPDKWKEYWEFSWCSMAKYDQPALWNYI